MKKIIYCILTLLALFSLLQVQAEDNQPNRFTVHPSFVQISGKDSGLSIGFGLIEAEGDKTRTWNIFPIRFSLKSGDRTLYLNMNGLSFLTRSGVYYGGEKVIKGVHHGDVISVGGQVTVQGKVEGNVWSFGADIHLLANSEVTGDVVALGGKVDTVRGARIHGNKHSLPKLTIPFLGFLTSPQSAETLQFIMELFGVLLFLIMLFLIIHFRRGSLLTVKDLFFSRWKGVLLYLILGILIIPIVVALLITSGIGIFVLPVLFLLILILVYFSYVGASVRLGQLILKRDTNSAAQIYLQGLLGFFIIKIPSLLGRLISLLTADVFTAVGGFLKVLGSVFLLVVLLYSFGVGLLYLKSTGRET